MKKLFVFALNLLVLTACAPTIQKVVTLPDPLRLAIESGAVLVVGWVFVQIGKALPWFVNLFGQYQDEIAFGLAGAVVMSIQNILNAIPPQWETPANLFLAFIVAVFAALQAFRLLGKAGVKSFRG